MKNITLFSERKAPLKLLLTIALLVLCSLSFLLINRINNMSLAANLVNHSNTVRLALSETLSRLKDAESGSRGFIMSKDSVFLGNFFTSEKDLNDHLNRLTILISDNPTQVKQADTLKTLVHKRLNLLQTVLTVYSQKELSRQELNEELLKGKAAMDEVKSRLVTMEKTELQILDQRIAKSEHYIITTPLFAIVLTAVALLMILFAFYKLRRQLRRSNQHGKHAEKEAEKAYSLLENAEQIAGIASWEWNQVTQKIERSNNLYRLYGYEPGLMDPSLDNFLPLIDEEDRDNLLQKLEEFRAQGLKSYTYQFWITRKDGARRYFECNCRFSKNDRDEDIITGTIQDITDEHLLRQEAQQRAYLLEQVVEHNIDLISVMDTQMRVQLWNQAYEQAFGISRHEILGKKITDVFPYLENDTKVILTKAALEGKETIRKQLPFLKDQRTGEISFIPLRDINGKIEGVLTIIHDITELKKATELLKESNIRFEQAEEAGKLGSYKRNTKTGEGTVSANLYRLFGIEPGNITPTTDMFLKMVHPEDQQRVIEALEKNASSGVIHPVHCRTIWKDGSVRFIKASAIPVQNERGEPVIYGSISDITEEEHLKQQLEKTNTELQDRNKALQEAFTLNRHINDLAPNGIFVFDNNKKAVVFANKKMQDLHGYSEKELNEMGIEFLVRLVHPDDLPQLFNDLERFETATDEDVVELEYRMRTKDGSYRNIICREAVFRRNETGEPEQFIGVAIDVTELKSAEKELKEKNQELLQTNEELASLNYIASHDLQEPLRKILTFCDYLKHTEKGLSEQGFDSLQRMQRTSSRMRALINDLQAFSRIDLITEEVESVDLSIVLHNTISSLRKNKEDNGLIVIADELSKVQGISFLLQQLFENIFSNAIKYCTPEKKPKVVLTCKKVPAGQSGVSRLKPEQEYYRLSFQDNGIGFEQEYADKIFDLFKRLHAQSEFNGTGLGLAICKKIVQKHGGHIQANSQPGAGSVFEIFLPCK